MCVCECVSQFTSVSLQPNPRPTISDLKPIVDIKRRTLAYYIAPRDHLIHFLRRRSPAALQLLTPHPAAAAAAVFPGSPWSTHPLQTKQTIPAPDSQVLSDFYRARASGSTFGGEDSGGSITRSPGMDGKLPADP